jgi:hypothetical protein
MLKRRAIPFPLTADSPEDELLGPVKRKATLWDDQAGVQTRRTAKVRIEKRGKYHVGVSDHPINETLAQFPSIRTLYNLLSPILTNNRRFAR